MAVQFRNKLGEMTFSVADYHKMIEVGVLREDNKTEIIEGKLIEIMPIGKKHAACVKRIAETLQDILGKSVTYSVQDPITVGEYNEPIPDIALLRRREDFYADALPSAKDVLLIIEVADSSLASDRKWKTGLYAEAGIREVWIVNLQREIIEIYSRPQHGVYALTKFAMRGEVLESANVPNLSLEVDRIF